MVNPEFTVTIDWTSATHLPGNIIPREDVISASKQLSRIRAINGYTDAVATIEGAIAQTSQTREDMGVQFIYTGSTLARLLEAGITPYYVLKYHAKRGAQFPRVDIAIDCYDFDLTVKDAYDLMEVGELQTKAKSKPQLRIEPGGGATLYIGKPSGEWQFRYYNKAAEQGIEGIKWTRLEMACKSPVSDAVAWLICDKAISEMGTVIRSIMSEKLWSSDPRWREMMEGAQDGKLSVPRETNRNTAHWLTTQVVSAIVNGIASGKLPRNVMDEMKVLVDRELTKRTVINDTTSQPKPALKQST